MHRKMFILATSAWLLSACGGGSTEPVVIIPIALSTEQMTAIQSALWPSSPYVVRSQAQWQAAWDARYQNLITIVCSVPTICAPDPGPPIPNFDFERFTLIGIFGELSPGQSVQLERLVIEDGVIHVYSRRSTQIGIFAQVQSPFHIYFLIPKTDLPVRFHE